MRPVGWIDGSSAIERERSLHFIFTNNPNQPTMTDAPLPKKPTGFQIPADLAEIPDLTVAQLGLILANRARQKTLQNRIAAHPAKLKALHEELNEVRAKESALLNGVTE